MACESNLYQIMLYSICTIASRNRAVIIFRTKKYKFENVFRKRFLLWFLRCRTVDVFFDLKRQFVSKLLCGVQRLSKNRRASCSLLRKKKRQKTLIALLQPKSSQGGL